MYLIFVIASRVSNASMVVASEGGRRESSRSCPSTLTLSKTRPLHPKHGPYYLIPTRSMLRRNEIILGSFHPETKGSPSIQPRSTFALSFAPADQVILS